MSSEKDIRFSEKKVDESWKAQIDKEKGKIADVVRPQETPASSKSNQTSKPFLDLLSSLAYQVMMFFREASALTPEQMEQAAPEIKNTVELLKAVQAKTAGNLSAEEQEFFDKILPELESKVSEL